MSQHLIILYDLENQDEIVEWAEDNCKSFVESRHIDVSDISLRHDTLHDFIFEDEGDAAWFKLRWL